MKLTVNHDATLELTQSKSTTIAKEGDNINWIHNNNICNSLE
jgi:hypothetical protein